MKYCWLNIQTGQFGGAFTKEECGEEHLTDEDFESQMLKDNEIMGYDPPLWKLIKFECMNDKDFEFIDKMKL